MKRCCTCKQDKHYEAFFKDKSRGDGHEAQCKSCRKKGRSSKAREQTRNQHLKRTYGITTQIYNEMFNRQEGRCLICKRHQSELTQKLHVDHCHSSGIVRGLLCYNCNQALGNIKDSITSLKSAIAYLQEHGHE